MKTKARAKPDAEGPYRCVVLFTEAGWAQLTELALLKRGSLYGDGDSARVWVIRKAVALYSKRLRRKLGDKQIKRLKAAKAALEAAGGVATSSGERRLRL